MALYFGLPFNGQHDHEYPDRVEGIAKYTDDSIFFASQLCIELSNHADQLPASSKTRFGKKKPRVVTPDFSKAIEADLMPNDRDYADWNSMFVKRNDKSTPGAAKRG